MKSQLTTIGPKLSQIKNTLVHLCSTQIGNIIRKHFRIL